MFFFFKPPKILAIVPNLFSTKFILFCKKRKYFNEEFENLNFCGHVLEMTNLS